MAGERESSRLGGELRESGPSRFLTPPREEPRLSSRELALDLKCIA